MTDIQFFIVKYRALVESKMGWGKSSDWQSQDFETLGSEIFEKTGVMLSASTLKRIWGKVRYDSTPSLATLDALALFVDFPNWRSFCNAQEDAPDSSEVPFNKTSYRGGITVTITLIVLLLVSFAVQHRSGKILQYSNVQFSSRPVTQGVPNTVIFKYDASASNADSVFIQQNWDARRRFKVDKEKHDYASIYYLPGYYRAKLVLDDSVVKEHDIFLESDWIGVLDKDPIPTYLPKELYLRNGQLGIREEDLSSDSKHFQKEVPEFVLTKVSRKMDVPSEGFVLSMLLQNTFDQVRAPCRRASVMLIGTDGVIKIPMSAPGCVGDLQLRLGGRQIMGNTSDFSRFGVDFSKPVRLRCTAFGGQISIDLNDAAVFKTNFSEGIGRIVGVRISFEGSGIVKDFELKKKNS